MSDEEPLDENEEKELDTFQIEIERVTKFVTNPDAAREEEQKELNGIDRTLTTTTTSTELTTSTIPTTPSMTSTELSVSYSDISDDTPYIHGAMLSAPKSEFHRESAIQTVVEIHDLLITRDQTLFFIHSDDDEENSGSELIMNDEELSEQRKKFDGLSVIDETSLPVIKPKNSKRLSSSKAKVAKKIKKRAKRQNKLQKSLSERGLTFAIRFVFFVFSVIIYNNKCKDNIINSEGHVFFNWGAFFREYIYNFFNAFLLPIMLWNEGKSGVQSRLYWPCEWKNWYGWMSLGQVISFFYINILYVLFVQYQDHQVSNNYLLTVIVYDIVYLTRIGIIAIKWAYLPPQIFPMMRKKRLSTDQFAMIHLLSGWVSHENKTGLAREIGQCCARLELDINKLKFAFRDERRQKMKSDNLCLRRRCSTYETYGNLLIPYIVFCASRAVSKWTKSFQYFAFISSPIICICPLAARIVEFPSFIEFKNAVGIYGIIWYIFCWMFMVQNLMTLILFCSVIALDFKRRYQFVRFSTRLIELKKNAFDGFIKSDYKHHLFPHNTNTKQDKQMLESAVIQTLDLSDAETMYNWSQLRAFFLDFGLRFLRREEAILGWSTLSILFIVGFYFTCLYAEIITPNYWEVAFVILSSTSVLFPAFSAIRYATRINQKVSEQRSILADKRLRLEKERSSVDEETIRQINTIRNIQSVLESEDDDDRLDDDASVNQQIEATAASIGRASLMLEKIVKLLEVDRFRIRLLGYSIDTTVTGIIAAVVGTVGFLVARLVLGSEVEGLPDT